MKFLIEVDDFYMDDQEDLEPKLKQYIISSCVQQITKKLEQKIEEGVNKEVKAQVEQALYRKIGTFVGECIANDKIKGRYSSDPEMTLQEFVKKQFVDEAGKSTSKIDELIKKLATQFGDEMKKRYDLLFASQLVVKMKESGFLKEEAIKLLLNENQ